MHQRKWEDIPCRLVLFLMLIQTQGLIAAGLLPFSLPQKNPAFSETIYESKLDNVHFLAFNP